MNIIELTRGPAAYWGKSSLVPFFPKVLDRAEIASILHVLSQYALSTQNKLVSFSGCVRLTFF